MEIACRVSPIQRLTPHGINITIGHKMESDLWLKKMGDVLREFSSREFQERVWLKGLGPEVSSYEEAMCRLFDDLGLSRLVDMEWRQAGLSEDQVSALRNFRENLLRFDKDIPEIPKAADISERSSSEGVRASARQTLAVFDRTSCRPPP